MEVVNKASDVRKGVRYHDVATLQDLQEFWGQQPSIFRLWSFCSLLETWQRGMNPSGHAISSTLPLDTGWPPPEDERGSTGPIPPIRLDGFHHDILANLCILSKFQDI
jgi:hypothetical protein